MYEQQNKNKNNNIVFEMVDFCWLTNINYKSIHATQTA